MMYPKTDNLFQRGPDGLADLAAFTRPEFESISRWHVSEKIDGMNVRILYEPDQPLRFKGRTDAAIMPPHLLAWLEAHLTPATVAGSFGPTACVIFGEGYGGKIQSGGRYNPTPKFRIFDIFSNGLTGGWMRPDEVAYIARAWDIQIAPSFGVLPTSDIVEMVQRAARGKATEFAITAGEDGSGQDPFEGVVAVSSPTLYDRWGARIKWKLKCRDLVRQ